MISLAALRPGPRARHGVGVAAAVLAATATATLGAAVDAHATGTYQVTATVPVGSSFSDLVIDSAAHKSFGLGYVNGSSTLVGIDDVTNRVLTTTALGGYAQYIAVDPTSHDVLVTDGSPVGVSVIQPGNSTPISITVGSSTQLGRVAVDSAAGVAYVVGETSGFLGSTTSLYEINLTTDAVSTVVTLADQYQMGAPAMTIDASTHKGYISDYSGISVVDLGAGTVTGTIAAPTLQDLVSDPVRHLLYGASQGTLLVIDPDAMRVTTTVPLTGSPQRVALDSAAGRAYVSNYQYNSVEVVDQATNTVIADVPAGNGPQALAVDPGTHDVRVADTIDKAVSVIRNIPPAPQTIRFTSTPPSHAKVHGRYLAKATGGGSGLPVSFSADPYSYGACSVSAVGLVTFNYAGTCIIDADQTGTAAYTAARTVHQRFTITRRTQHITFPPLQSLRVRHSEPLHAASDSRLLVSYRSLTPHVCTVLNRTVHAAKPGTCTIAAHVGGTMVYRPAAQQTRHFTVSA